MQGAFLYAGAIGICAGVALGFLVGNALSIAGAGLLIGSVLLFLGRKNALLFVAAAALAAAALGLVRADLFLQSERQQNLTTFVGEKTEVVGVVVNDPERRDTSLHVHIGVLTIDGRAARGKLLAQLPREQEVSYGDTVSVAGRVEEPQAFETDTGRIFDYRSYLRARGISAVMRYAVLESKTEAPLSLPKVLFSIKHAFTNSLERIFAEPQGSLLQGLLLGERRGLPQELTNAFIASGLIHVVVLSGYNISIVADGVLRIFAFLPRTLGFSLGGATIFLFVLMIGSGATAVRALIMGLIAILARYFGRSALALRALAVAAGGMVLWNPTSLLFDPSFILSVLATFGLITLSPWVESKLPKFFSRVPQIHSIAASTIAVQIYVLPALLYMTGVLSLFALPANVLALPAVPFAMGFGFSAGLLGLIHPLLALPAALVTDLLLRFVMFVATAAHALPFSATVVATFPLWVAIVAYIPLTALALSLYNRSEA